MYPNKDGDLKEDEEDGRVHSSRSLGDSLVGQVAVAQPGLGPVALLGMTVMLPWNIILTVPDYFEALFSDVFLSQCAAVFQAPNLVLLVFQAFLLNRYVNARCKVLASYTVIIASFAVVLVTAVLWDPARPGPRWQMLTWQVAIFCFGAAISTLQGSLFGVFAAVGGKHVGRLMQGNGFGGLAIGALRVILKLAMSSQPEGLRRQAIVFFSCGLAAMVAAMFAYLRLLRLPCVRRASLATEPADLAASTCAVLREMMPAPLAIIGVYAVTLNLCPAVTDQIRPNFFANEEWFTLSLTMVFLLTDFLGRYFAGFRCVVRSVRVGTYTALARIILLVFLPALAYGKHPGVPDGVASDVCAIMMVALMGLSSGYAATMLMICAPQAVAPDRKAQAGLAMTMCLVAGLALGTSTGTLWPANPVS